ncbi:hypothetical protein BCR34DRAFT_491768, partial [Clohesyomyces aquaticus]
ISPTEPLLYSTLLPWIKTLGQIIGFAQVSCPYLLQYVGRKAFNENSKLYRAIIYKLQDAGLT